MKFDEEHVVFVHLDASEEDTIAFHRHNFFQDWRTVIGFLDRFNLLFRELARPSHGQIRAVWIVRAIPNSRDRQVIRSRWQSGNAYLRLPFRLGWKIADVVRLVVD